MFGLGIGELLVVLLVLVLLFGASRLPQLGAGLGEGIKSFRKAFRDIREEDEIAPARALGGPEARVRREEAGLRAAVVLRPGAVKVAHRRTRTAISRAARRAAA